MTGSFGLVLLLLICCTFSTSFNMFVIEEYSLYSAFLDLLEGILNKEHVLIFRSTCGGILKKFPTWYIFHVDFAIRQSRRKQRFFPTFGSKSFLL